MIYSPLEEPNLIRVFRSTDGRILILGSLGFTASCLEGKWTVGENLFTDSQLRDSFTEVDDPEAVAKLATETRVQAAILFFKQMYSPVSSEPGEPPPGQTTGVTRRPSPPDGGGASECLLAPLQAEPDA